MLCSNCSFENPEGVKFCGECGKSLIKLCQACGFESPGTFNFCGNCGNHLTGSGQKQIQEPGLNAVPEAERRRLTVMFCDLVGSTAMSHELDPEDLRSVIRQYQDLCRKEVAKFEGHIAQYLGDGILVYFGYPTAHEDEASRAIRSALGILNAIKDLNQKLVSTAGTVISIRIGIHTGQVVIGSIGAEESSQQLALGAAPNIAAKLEGMALPDSIVISSNTYELVKSHFKFEDLGKQQLKGIETAIRIYQVISDITAINRLDDNFSTHELPLVGRHREVQQILKYWKKAKNGNSYVVMLSGEAGIGKSKILQTIVSRLANEKNLWLIPHQCSPYHRNTAFYPIASAMKRLGLEMKGDESVNEQINRLEKFLEHFSLSVNETLPLFAGILSIPLEGSGYRTAPFSIEQQKQKITNALLSIYVQRASENNLLLIFEDLHWIDFSSLEVINQLVDQNPRLNMLTILSFRPEFEPTWGMKPHLIMLPLSNLFHDAVETIIGEIADGKKIPETLVDQIVQKTDGVPLFVEELTKMVLNSEMVIEHDDHYELSGPISTLEIPNTLHDSLLARLDRMDVARKIAQIGSVIGREFNYSLILEASEMYDNLLKNCLQQLVEAEILLQSGAIPTALFKFRHALIRDAAYQSLLKSQQQQLHKSIAVILDKQYQEDPDKQPATLAYHFEKGSVTRKAIKYWILAANKVREYQAFDEALGYLQRALNLLTDLSDQNERDCLELQILSAQAPLYLMTAGWGSKLTFNASERLEQLAENQGDKVNLFKALRISTIYELFTGIPAKALGNAKKALAIAEEMGNQEFRIEANRLIGQTSIFNGLLIKSKESFNEAIKLHTTIKKVHQSEFSSGDPGIISLTQSGHVLWQLGYPDQGLQRVAGALKQSDLIDRPYDQCICLFIGAMVNFWCGNTERSMELGSRCIELSNEYGISFFGKEASTFVAACTVIRGDVKQGLELLEETITTRPQIARQGFNIHVATMAEICLKTGDYNLALDALERSFQLYSKTKDHFFRSETFRTKGDLLFAKDGDAHIKEIESCYKYSLEISRSQSAKSLELRTTMSMAKLKKSMGKMSEALNLILPVYSWFTEGLETRDLAEARALINELSITWSQN